MKKIFGTGITVCLMVLLFMACNHTTKNTNKSIVFNEAFHQMIDNKEVDLFELKNKAGLSALITNYGGRLVSLWVPDKTGVLRDVVAGFDSVSGYEQSKEPYFGALIGRYGNRIAKGMFSLEGKTYNLFINNAPNTLHGGNKGYQAVVWDAKQLDAQRLELSYMSPDMEEGFPGNLKMKVIYELTDRNGLKITYEAVTDQTTVVNLTNHAFFNLNGEASGSILDHWVKVNADHYTPVDATIIPTGKIELVKGTPFDFQIPVKIGARINDPNEQLANGKGYDHNFVLNNHQMTDPVAEVTGDQSGIVMRIYTTEPGLQFYSGNFMQGKNVMKGGHKDDFRTAFAMETQHYPDSPNQPQFPSTVLKPGEVYQSTSIYEFGLSTK